MRESRISLMPDNHALAQTRSIAGVSGKSTTLTFAARQQRLRFVVVDRRKANF
jgi:hypothetical protein